MKIIAQVKAGAKVEKVEFTGKSNVKVWVKAPAKEGKANKAVVAALAKYFGTAQSNVEIISGHKSREKVMEVTR